MRLPILLTVVVAVNAVPAIGATSAPDPLQICTGPYAICAAAACKPIPSQANGQPSGPTEALCECQSAQGANLGPGGCEERAAGAGEGKLMSTYSFALVATHPSMICPSGAYTDCFGSPCLVDAQDPSRAVCTCSIDDNTAGKPFVTQGGGCDTDRCADTLWSSTTVVANAITNQKLASALGLQSPPENHCPANAEAAAAEALCVDYCYQVMGEPGACKGPFQIYADLPSCLKTCRDFPTNGVTDAVSGNSVQCRIEHAKLAQGNDVEKGIEAAKKHCPHAAPGGGGVCVDRSPCLAYCLFYYDRVSEKDCPQVDAYGSFLGSEEQGTGKFTPNPKCMETCAGFAEAGQEWEMSGESANCRMQFYLMAHRLDKGAQRDSLCRNADPFKSEMCQGYTFGDYYKVRQTDPCKELCYNDWLSCSGSWGKDCEKKCGLLPMTGQRQDTQGDNVYCRLTWAQYAFFVQANPSMQKVFCDFAQPESLVCRDPGSSKPLKGATLPPEVQMMLMKH